jgi:hypothetical protein
MITSYNLTSASDTEMNMKNLEEKILNITVWELTYAIIEVIQFSFETYVK